MYIYMYIYLYTYTYIYMYVSRLDPCTYLFQWNKYIPMEKIYSIGICSIGIDLFHWNNGSLVFTVYIYSILCMFLLNYSNGINTYLFCIVHIFVPYIFIPCLYICSAYICSVYIYSMFNKHGINIYRPNICGTNI